MRILNTQLGLARSAFAFSAVVAACSGQVFKAERCESLSQMTCPVVRPGISFADDRLVAGQLKPYSDGEKNDLTALVNEQLDRLPACFTLGLEELAFTSNVKIEIKGTTGNAAGEYVCTSFVYPNGDVSTKCRILINTDYIDKEENSLAAHQPHYWLYGLVHEICHNALSLACNDGGFKAVSFDPDGLPKSSSNNDFAFLYSAFPNYKHDLAKASAKEDFAYACASYFLDGAQFRAQAQSSPMMAAKYSILHNHFFGGLEY